MLYDVQAVRFIKTTAQMPVNINTTADFICLGHFDMMHIARLGDFTTKPLQEIQIDRDNVGESGFGCTENHVYSLYVLKNVPEAHQVALSDFWGRQTTYTVVTRIHCDYPPKWNRDKLPFSSIIEQYCAAQIQPSARVVYHQTTTDEPSCVVSFDSAINYEGKVKARVDCVFYDSLELGDTVSFMKGNSIAAILEVIRCLSANYCVKDTYTYCGINREVLQKNETESSSYVEKDSELAYISTRFSVRDIRNANVFFRALEKDVNALAPQFYVTGTADRSIRWGGSKEEQLIEIMRSLTRNSQNMHHCFNDVITRIGIKQVIEGSPNDTLLENDIPDISLAIPSYKETMKWLREDYRKHKTIDWKYSLLKLLGTLEAMFSNYVMDDLADLIIPSVEAFLVRLNHLRSQNAGTVPYTYDDDIILFLNCWTSLMNDVSQLESQLTQHPELMPVRYYIPAMVLQFELRFVEYCCKALSAKDSRNFVPMLLPVESSDLYTLCPLDPRQETYSDACPLLVFIPFKDLYRPWETAFVVAHEMAHYCEDISRKRIERHKALINCAATYTVKYWYNEYILPFIGKSQEELYQKTLDFAVKLSNMFSERVDLDFPDEQWYLSQSVEALYREVMRTIASPSFLEQYLFEVCPSYFYENQCTYRQIRREEQQTAKCMSFQDRFEKHMDLLTFLCAECYADIAMILLTDCDFSDYFTSVYLDQYTQFVACEKETKWLIKDPYVMRQVVRMALVIHVISRMKSTKPTWNKENIALNQASLVPLVECAIVIVNQCDGTTDKCILTEDASNHPLFASVDDFNNIAKYLTECAEALEAEFTTGSDDRLKAVQVVREGIACVQNGAFNWNGVQQYILK